MTSGDDVWKGRLIVGIDLGTTYSALAAWDEAAGRVRLVLDARGRELLPSVVTRDRRARAWAVGHDALALRGRDPAATAYSVKRFIGRRLGDPTVLEGQRTVAYKLVSGDPGDALREVLVDFGPEDGAPQRLSLPEVSAKVLEHLCRGAAERLGPVRHAVVTVPAYFNMLQRRATILAGQLAGLEVVDILDEPTAAALASCRDLLGPEQKKVLVYDLGGGTFDVSLLEASRDDEGYAFYTRAVDGDTCLGGDDIDLSVAGWLAEQIEQRYGRAVRADDAATRERLRCAAEQAKRELSGRATAAVELPGLDTGDGPPFDASLELTADRLERRAADVVQRTQDIVKRVVSEAGLRPEQIDEVILVGGQTLMPAVRRAVEDVFGREPRCGEQPQAAVALGAGEYAHIRSLGRERFHQNTLRNVIPLPVGIRLEDSKFVTLVRANAPVPFVSPPYYVTTREDNQTRIHVEVLQGRRGAGAADQCVLLGSIDMDVPPGPAGKPKFEVKFKVESDGTMRVSVTDTRLNRCQLLDIITTRIDPPRNDSTAGPFLTAP
jgi:molecular chaperone DnaK